jgi:hypothetical protein
VLGGPGVEGHDRAWVWAVRGLGVGAAHRRWTLLKRKRVQQHSVDACRAAKVFVLWYSCRGGLNPAVMCFCSVQDRWSEGSTAALEVRW